MQEKTDVIQTDVKSQVEITEDNFKDYFFPAKEDYKPTKGQVLARWRATADFVDGWIKRNIIQMLCENSNGAETSYRIMKKLVSATDGDAVKVLREMAQDLSDGVPLNDVAEKPYRFTVEQFYWTKREYLPNDIHWDLIHCVDTRELPDGIKIETKIVGLPDDDQSGTVSGV